MKTLYKLALVTVLFCVFLSCDKAELSGAGGVTGAGGSTARFTIVGNYLYVVDHLSLKSFDITDPNNPKYKDKTEVGQNIETIFPYQDKLFIGSSSSMYIYSLVDPSRPLRVGKADYTISFACDPIVVKDGTAYASLRVEAVGVCGGRGFGNSSLVVYDISNINTPILKLTIDLQTPQGLGIKDHALYVCERSNGLKVFDITSAYSPVLAKTITTDTFFDVIPYGNILICQVDDGFALYDIGTDPLNPTFISKLLH